MINRIIYTTLPSFSRGGGGMNCLSLNRLASDGYEIKYNYKKINGQYIWCNWSDVVLHYNYEDAPDKPGKIEKLLKWHQQLYEAVGDKKIFVQCWPNAKSKNRILNNWIRVVNAPYPVARPFLMDTIKLQPNFEDKNIDIYTSWKWNSWSGVCRYRQTITELAAEYDWGDVTGGIYFKAKEDFGKQYDVWRDRKTTGRLYNIFGPPFESSVWKSYIEDYLMKAKVSWDSMGNDSSPYCHRFSECGRCGVCVIKEGRASNWYEPGKDYILEEDPQKAFYIAFEVIKSGEWKKYAINLYNKWNEYESPKGVAKYILNILNKSYEQYI